MNLSRNPASRTIQAMPINPSLKAIPARAMMADREQRSWSEVAVVADTAAKE